MKFAGSESLPRVEHFACDGFPSGMEHFHIRWIPFPAGVFCMRQIYRLPAGAFCMRQVYLLPAGAFRMRQLRGGEAFIVAKAISPPRAPPLRPRSFVVRCGDVCMYWWGDGCCGIGYKTLCRFIPILHNFLQSITYSPQTTRKLSLSSTPSSAALTAHPTPGKPLSLTL